MTLRLVRLGRLFERRKILGYVDEPMLSVFREHGVVLKDDMVNYNQTAEDRSIYQLVEPGWLAVNRMKAWQGSVGVSLHRGIMSGHYICFAPTHSENGRYLHYLLRSTRVTAHFASISRGVRPGQIEIDNDQLAATPLELPDPEEQRRIADFLDDRVARIDQIITARQGQAVLSIEYLKDAISVLMDRAASTSGHAPMRRFCTGIEQGWSPLGEERPRTEGECGVLKTSAIQFGRFLPDNSKVVPQDVVDERFRVRDGDVLVVRGSGSADLVGDAATAQLVEGTRLYLSDLTYRLRGLTIDPEFATLSLISARGRSELGARVRQGSGPAKARGDDILELPVPCAPTSAQEAIVEEVRRLRAQQDVATALLYRSVETIREYKQSLITAAVTGELDVTTAGSGIPG